MAKKNNYDQQEKPKASSPQRFQKKSSVHFNDYESARKHFDGLQLTRKVSEDSGRLRIRRRQDGFDVVTYERLSKK